MTARKIKSPFRVGDLVRPKRGYKKLGVPTGRVVKIEPFGDDGAIHILGARGAFSGNCLELVPKKKQVRR